MKFFQYISYFSIGSALILMLVAGFWLLYPYNPIDFSTPFPVTSENRIIQGGQYISYQVDYCKHSKVIPLISKYFVDSLIFEVPIGIALDNPLGCHTNNVQMYIPRTLPPGEYFIKIVYHYQVNPIRNIDVIGFTEKFVVVNN